MEHINDISVHSVYTLSAQRADYARAVLARADAFLTEVREIFPDWSPNLPDLDKRPTKQPKRSRGATIGFDGELHVGDEIEVGRGDESVEGVVLATVGPVARVWIRGEDGVPPKEQRLTSLALLLTCAAGMCAVAGTALLEGRKVASRLARDEDPVAAQAGREAMSRIDSLRSEAGSVTTAAQAASIS